ncbi:MAG TPA: RodZ domain-containing protein [Alphaproteobacteria bacterium]|jgi:cytoskeleton protein RodZ
MAQRKNSNRRDHDESDLAQRMMIGAGRQSSIGDDLRAARQARGEDLQDIAAQLRIRFVFLEAIENGAFDSLPGPTYAIGFVRAYARYLRLDADDMIARFKEEASGIAAPSDLTFPEPVSESRVPRGGLVVIAILLAVAAYGGWYYLSTRDMTIADMVPSVPSDFPGAASNDAAGLPADIADLAPPTTPDEADVATATAPDMMSAAPAPAAEPAAPAPTQAGNPAPIITPAPTPSQAPVQAPATQAATPAAPIPAVPNLNALAPAPAAETADAGPRVYGEGNVDARIVLRARGDSWVQIRASDDSLIMTRTLRSGDSYRVPNQGGLKLMTGNAGSLDIVVDGQTTPSLGPYGAVRRNVALDVDRLKAGTATPN